MLNDQFKHRAWFIGETMTVKQFLDYVLSNGDFTITTKSKADSNDLLSEPVTTYYLSDRRYSMKLDYQERNYLASKDEYFKSKLPKVTENYMMAIIAKCGEPIEDIHDIVYLSR